MRASLIGLPVIEKASKRVFSAMSRKMGDSPSKQQARARAALQRAGFKIGPGVDLKMK